MTPIRKSAHPSRPRVRGLRLPAGSWREKEVGPDAFASRGQGGGAPLVAEGGDDAQATADFGVVVGSEAGGHDIAGVSNLAAQSCRQAQ